MSRVQVLPGEVAALVLEHTTGLSKKAAGAGLGAMRTRSRS